MASTSGPLMYCSHACCAISTSCCASSMAFLSSSGIGPSYVSVLLASARMGRAFSAFASSCSLLHRWGVTYVEALSKVDYAPRRVFQKIDYTITAPEYPVLPLLFLMTGKWGGSASRWMDTPSGIAKQEVERRAKPRMGPRDLASQMQPRQPHNDKGDFVEAVVGIANVKAAQRA